jgi:hypothetical protein
MARLDPTVEQLLSTHRFLLQEISGGNAVLFVGAGVSERRYPTWTSLTRDLAAEASLPTQDVDALDLLQWYVEARGRDALEERLVQTFAEPVEPTELQRLLVRYPWDLIFTTNYDRLLEHAFHERGRDVDVIVEDTQVGRVTERSRTTLVKMHGCISRPQTMVVTREDYDVYEARHPATIMYLQSLLANRTFLFVGFSLRDPNFRDIYRIVQQELGSFRRYAYAIMLERSVNEYTLQYWRRQRLLILPLPGPEQVLEFMHGAQETASKWAARRRELPAILDGLGDSGARLSGMVDDIRRAVDEVYDAIRPDLLQQIRQRGDEAGPERQAALLWSQTTAEERQQLYSLHNLLQLLQEIGIPYPAQRWLRLGNTLYELEKWDLALQAFQRVHRRLAQGRWDDSEVHPKEIASNLARCYLSVAQERLQAFRRTSADNRVVLDLAEYEWAAGHLAYCILASDGGLDRDWLTRRPSDLAEYAYASNRLAEIDMARGRLEEAAGRLQQALLYQEDGRDLYDRLVGGARAFALNHLGKTYRLGTEIAVALGRMDDARRWFDRARQTLWAALDVSTDLGYPYGHLFDLLRLVDAKGLAESLDVDVGAERRALRERLGAAAPDTREWLQAHYAEAQADR